jgi:rfaE bifunctional protein nucleotidyltransferase chain/domain
MKIIFTNGVFDVIHRGHCELLRYCRYSAERTHVIVGLNTDRSVKALKGDSRPINSQDERQFVLESLKDVDEVVLFDEETPYELIKRIQPDLIIKGGDYEPEQVSGFDICPVSIFKCFNKDGEKMSSSTIIDKLKKNY